MTFAVIAENDISQWHDVTGVSYHFPRRYQRLLAPGTEVIYYKGVLRKRAFRDKRLSDRAHYFGTATIGRVYADPTSPKGDLFAEIREFHSFETAVDIRHEGEFIEAVPDSRRAFHWRDGVRSISEETYRRIVSMAVVTDESVKVLVTDREHLLPDTFVSGVEGTQSLRLVSTYERNPRLRDAAVRIHGTTCKVCGFNFALVYGQHGAGYIQVHHLQPLADGSGQRSVDPKTEMDVLCANCHAMVHRFRGRTLSLEQLRLLIAENSVTPH